LARYAGAIADEKEFHDCGATSLEGGGFEVVCQGLTIPHAGTVEPDVIPIAQWSASIHYDGWVQRVRQVESGCSLFGEGDHAELASFVVQSHAQRLCVDV
jgi:hypothetical protein